MPSCIAFPSPRKRTLEIMLPEIIVDTTAKLAEVLSARLERDGLRALAARGRFALALPGGSVARTFFPRLARASFDWSRADFFWGDERAVPVSDPESNYGLARSLWLDPASVPADRVHRIEAESADPVAAAAAYAHDLTRLLGQPPRLDLVLLGVGADGHICSLFPGHSLLREERQCDVAPITRRGRVGAGPLRTWVADVVRRTRLASDVQARHGADGDCNRGATH